MSKYFLGIDIGGTKTEIALLSDKGKSKLPLKVEKKNYHILLKKRMPTQKELGYQNLIIKLASFIQDTLTKHKISMSMINGIGIGLPASVDPTTGLIADIKTSPFNAQNLAKDLKKELKYKKTVISDNDANLFIYAETFWGAGLNFAKKTKINPTQHNSMGVTLGTGVGGGIIIQGKIHRGRNGGAGEIGHTPVESNGRACFCGRLGCAEVYLSGTGIELEWQKQFTDKKLSSSEIFKEASSKIFFEKYQERLANFLANLANTLNLDYIVLGGGVSNQKVIYQGLEAKVKKYSYIPNNTIKIYQNRLSDSAGVLGAALLALKIHDKS
ncbi:MAG: ROK family protein [Bacteriovoracaceae bacterium]|nr:ROK family protein [Bacteriovoracaceae bacterium]